VGGIEWKKDIEDDVHGGESREVEAGMVKRMDEQDD
jgi:hypothetical protein